jgi:1,4-dihydroxy-2-naphthoyl-CoA hydrolase
MEIEKNIEEKVAWFFENQTENMGTTLGISYLKISRNELIAEMPVDSRTVQPFRILHGGASVALAETLCSIGSWVNIPDSKTAVGIEINANHHRSVKEGGRVKAIAKPIQLGRTIQVWETRIEDERGKLVCTSRCTLAIVERK